MNFQMSAQAPPCNIVDGSFNPKQRGYRDLDVRLNLKPHLLRPRRRVGGERSADPGTSIADVQPPHAQVVSGRKIRKLLSSPLGTRGVVGDIDRTKGQLEPARA